MSKATPEVQEYWLPGHGLSRNIVLSNIQYFLGPSATVWPYMCQVCPAQYCASAVAERNPAGARGLPHRWAAVDASKCTQEHPNLFMSRQLTPHPVISNKSRIFSASPKSMSANELGGLIHLAVNRAEMANRIA